MVEQPLLGWAGRNAYLTAKQEKDRIEVYAKDLLWLIAKRNYTGLKQPSDIYYNRDKTDVRTAKQIADDVVKKLRR